MEQPFRRNYLQHALSVNDWLRVNDAKGSIDAVSHVLDITHQGRSVSFIPQFMSGIGEDAGYVTQLQPGVSAFVSWLPGEVKGWPAAQGKLAFKAFAQQAQLKIPAWTRDITQVKGAFIVKHDKSSFGKGLQGPFYAGPPPAPPPALKLASGEFAEQFVVGQLIKAWYWNGELTVAEMVTMPSVRGDGQSSLKELLAQRLGQEGIWTEVHTAVVTLWGLAPDFVAPAGKDVVVDYRYMSDLNPAINQDCNVLPKIKGTPLADQLVQAGRAMHQGVPEPIRQHYPMTMDAVVDASGKVHFLEANCNPLLHPAFYPSMLDAIFKPPQPLNP